MYMQKCIEDVYKTFPYTSNLTKNIYYNANITEMEIKYRNYCYSCH